MCWLHVFPPLAQYVWSIRGIGWSVAKGSFREISLSHLSSFHVVPENVKFLSRLVLSWLWVICFPLGRISVSAGADSGYLQLGQCVAFGFKADFLNICKPFTFSVKSSCSCYTPPSSTMELKQLSKSAQHSSYLPVLWASFQNPSKFPIRSLNLTANLRNHWSAF